MSSDVVNLAIFSKLSVCAGVLAALLACAGACPAQEAQRFPAKPIRIIVPFAPGGTADVSARLMSQELAPRLGQPVIVDNRPGAGGRIGLEIAAGAAPDGYTLLLGTVDTQCILGYLHKDLKFDPVQGFAPVALLVRQEDAIATGTASGIRDFAELLAQGGAQPLFFASPGLGSHLHLLGELLNRRYRLKLEHVSYKGLGPAMPDTVSGKIQLIFGGVPPLLPLIREGRLRALATTGATRAAALPDVPTLAESGQPDLVITGWFGLLAPKATRGELVERLHREIAAVAATDAYQQRVASMQAIATLLGPAEFGRFIAAEAKRWGEAARSARLQLD